MTARPQDVALLPPLDPLPEDYKPREWECTHQAATYFYQEGHAAALASAQAREGELRAEVAENEGAIRVWRRRCTKAEARAERLAEALRTMVDEKVDYMLRNNLGNPYVEHTTKQAVAALSTNAATQTGETNEAAE